MELKFDKMGVDTSLAKEYLQTEIASNNIEEVKHEMEYQPDVLRSRLKEFAVKLKENKNLIVQLEYLLRDIPISDTIAQLDLIIQQTNYASKHSREVFNIGVDPNKILMTNDSPLLLLGYIAKTVLRPKSNDYVLLEYEDKSRAICHLFTKLCHDTKLPVILTKKDAVGLTVSAVPEGTVGVISEFSDIDSAVDILLASPERVPWQLQRILVQESVYQQFQNALTWKCNLNKQEKNNSTASDTLQYNGRLFLIDSLGTPAENPRQVLVEAYRTRKELKVLLNQYNPHYLSLWANDIAEINEIAHSVSSPIVWVNNFGDFRGPAKVTETLFCHWSKKIKINVFKLPVLKESWLKLDREARRDILCNVLGACATADTGENKIIYKIKDDLQNIDNNSPDAFIDVGKDYVCLGICMPSSKLFLKHTAYLTTDFFKSVLDGNAYVLSDKPNTQIPDIFRKAGLPIIFQENTEETTDGCVVHICDNFEVTQSTKVIWTNSGTIFAN